MNAELHFMKGSETVASIPVKPWNKIVKSMWRNGVSFDVMPQNVRFDRLEVVFTLPLDEWYVTPTGVKRKGGD